MSEYELVVAGGTVVTPSDMFRADVGVIGGRIAAIGHDLKGTRRLDADGLWVMPGGVDTHCHIEQLQAGCGRPSSNPTGSRRPRAGPCRPRRPAPPPRPRA